LWPVGSCSCRGYQDTGLFCRCLRGFMCSSRDRCRADSGCKRRGLSASLLSPPRKTGPLGNHDLLDFELRAQAV
jgi:hypothetical protein